MVEKILNNTTPYGKIRASHEGLLHSSTLSASITCILCVFKAFIDIPHKILDSKTISSSYIYIKCIY